MGLLSGLSALLHQYTGSKDLVIGTAVAGRSDAELSDQIGFYVNTLGLRQRVDSQDGFTALLRRTISTTLEDFEHQDYPFDQLVEDLNLKHDVTRNAVFDVMMTLQSNDQQGTIDQYDGLVRDAGMVLPKFDLDFTVEDQGEILEISMIYRSDLYDASMMEGLLQHYRQLLSEVVRSPETTVGKIDFLLETEKQTLLEAFNKSTSNTTDQTIIELFEERAKENPTAEAIKCGSNTLSYEALSEWSDAFAAFLVENYTPVSYTHLRAHETQ